MNMLVFANIMESNQMNKDYLKIMKGILYIKAAIDMINVRLEVLEEAIIEETGVTKTDQ